MKWSELEVGKTYIHRQYLIIDYFTVTEKSPKEVIGISYFFRGGDWFRASHFSIDFFEAPEILLIMKGIK